MDGPAAAAPLPLSTSPLYRALCAAEVGIAGSLLVAMVLLIFGGAVARALHHPLVWTTDVATALFAWACFLCADIAWRRDHLMSIVWLTSRLPPRLADALRWFNYALIAAFLLFVIVMGTWLSWISRERSFQGIPEVSYSWVTMSMPVGAGLLLLTTVLKFRAEWRSRHARAAGAAAATPAAAAPPR
jgi:TRAP-type C4-dicarboxylate transport system permease small subunit